MSQHAGASKHGVAERCAQLEQQVESLSEQMKSLREEFVEFKKQFD
jgi:chaperonin cofactor prefoldin